MDQLSATVRNNADNDQQANQRARGASDVAKQGGNIVGEISAASSEQSAGISQVGAAIMQMDRVTQQNAALVEGSTAAAESLKGQAQQLVQAVAVFKLSSR